MFRLGLLQRALAQAGPGITDEASAVEALGHAPKLVRGAFENFKLTYPPDFELAERLLSTRAGRHPVTPDRATRTLGKMTILGDKT
jgi:2-C-methyl-D-erythritol 4-phosphate cytidylyltransferase